MGTRKAKEFSAWEKEHKFISDRLADRDYRLFNNDPECFERYVLMQSKFMLVDGYIRLAQETLCLLLKVY